MQRIEVPAIVAQNLAAQRLGLIKKALLKRRDCALERVGRGSQGSPSQHRGW
jgi:hypothetical protein